jgi:hypothetical protein
MTENVKKLQVEKNLIFFINVSLGLHKVRLSYRSLQLRERLALPNMNFFLFHFLFTWAIFALLDPNTDPLT